MKAVCTMFGDEREYPVINSIVSILNEKLNNDNNIKYCITTIQELIVMFNSINHTDKRTRRYLIGLIKKDFLNRLDTSTLDENIKTHIRNLITALHNKKMKLIQYY